MQKNTTEKIIDTNESFIEGNYRVSHDFNMKMPPFNFYSTYFYGNDHRNYFLNLQGIGHVLISIHKSEDYYLILFKSIFGHLSDKIYKKHISPNNDYLIVLQVSIEKFFQTISKNFQSKISKSELTKEVKKENNIVKIKNFFFSKKSFQEEDCVEIESLFGGFTLRSEISIWASLREVEAYLKKNPEKFFFEKIISKIFVVDDSFLLDLLKLEKIFDNDSINVNLFAKNDSDVSIFGDAIDNEFFPVQKLVKNLKNDKFDKKSVYNKFASLVNSEIIYLKNISFLMFLENTNIINQEFITEEQKKTLIIFLSGLRSLFKNHCNILRQILVRIFKITSILPEMVNFVEGENLEIIKKEDLIHEIGSKLSLHNEEDFFINTKIIFDIFEKEIPNFWPYRSLYINDENTGKIIYSKEVLEYFCKDTGKSISAIKSDIKLNLLQVYNRISKYKNFLLQLESCFTISNGVSVVSTLLEYYNKFYNEKQLKDMKQNFQIFKEKIIRDNINITELNFPDDTFFLIQTDCDQVNNFKLTIFATNNGLVFAERIGNSSSIFSDISTTKFNFIKKVDIKNVSLEEKKDKLFIIIKEKQTEIRYNQIKNSNLICSEDYNFEKIELFVNDPYTKTKFKNIIRIYSKDSENKNNLLKKVVSNKNIFYSIENNYSKEGINVFFDRKIEKNKQKVYNELVCNREFLNFYIEKSSNDEYLVEVESSKKIDFQKSTIPEKNFASDEFSKFLLESLETHKNMFPIPKQNLILFKQNLKHLFNKMLEQKKYKNIQNYKTSPAGLKYMDNIRRLIFYIEDESKHRKELFDIKLKSTDIDFSEYKNILKTKHSHVKSFKKIDFNYLVVFVILYFKQNFFFILTSGDLRRIGNQMKNKDFNLDIIENKYFLEFVEIFKICKNEEIYEVFYLIFEPFYLSKNLVKIWVESLFSR